MAITGGAIAIGTALFQLASVWNKPVAKLVPTATPLGETSPHIVKNTVIMVTQPPVASTAEAEPAAACTDGTATAPHLVVKEISTSQQAFPSLPVLKKDSNRRVIGHQHQSAEATNATPFSTQA
jgi:hypothetical protein